MFCKHCGNQVDDNAQFCSSCGKTLRDKNVTAPKKEEKSIVSIIVASCISILMLVIFLVIAINEDITYKNLDNLQMTAIFCLVASLFTFFKTKKIYAEEKTRQIQVLYAVSIILLLLSALPLFAAILVYTNN